MSSWFRSLTDRSLAAAAEEELPFFEEGIDARIRSHDEEKAIEAKQQREWQRAVDTREFPDTPLAWGIFTNMHEYPDDIILTRVGMFYEVSKRCLLASVESVLTIRSASHTLRKLPKSPPCSIYA